MTEQISNLHYPSGAPIDTAPFQSDAPGSPRYGLPQDVRFCARCGISNQRPNSDKSEYRLTTESPKAVIHFDENNVCDACKVWETKNQTIDWAERERELREVCDRHRRSDGRPDCLVPGSGGKDSFRQSWLLKHKYGMHPLTITWAPQIYTDWGWFNLQNWIDSGFDNILYTPNGQVRRLLTRLALENLFHPFQPFVLGQKNIAARFCARYDIPLAFYGDHATEWGVSFAEFESALMDYSYFQTHGESEINIGGTTVAELKESFGLTDHDLEPYMPVDPAVVAETGMEIHYLGYYEKWHPQGNYYFAAENSNFQPSPERTPGTYSKFAGLDDKADDFNWYCYFIKFGFGRATTDAAQDVRAGDITRDEAVALIRRYDGEFPERFAEDFFKYASLPEDQFKHAARFFEQPVMDRAYFDSLADRFRSPHIWKHENGAWALRRAVYHGTD